jgi:hypothetical protein
MRVLESEFGSRIWSKPDKEIEQTMSERNRPAHKRVLPEQAEREKDRQRAANASAARINTRMQESSAKALK